MSIQETSRRRISKVVLGLLVFVIGVPSLGRANPSFTTVRIRQCCLLSDYSFVGHVEILANGGPPSVHGSLITDRWGSYQSFAVACVEVLVNPQDGSAVFYGDFTADNAPESHAFLKFTTIFPALGAPASAEMSSESTSADHCGAAGIVLPSEWNAEAGLLTFGTEPPCVDPPCEAGQSRTV